MIKGMLWTVVALIGIYIIIKIKLIFEVMVRIINIPFIIGKLNAEGKVEYLANITADIIWYGVFIFIFVICLKFVSSKPKSKKENNSI